MSNKSKYAIGVAAAAAISLGAGVAAAATTSTNTDPASEQTAERIYTAAHLSEAGVSQARAAFLRAERSLRPADAMSARPGVAPLRASASAGTVSANQFDPKNFGEPATGANRWFPLEPGYQSVREGSVNRGRRRLTHRRVYTVTDVTKVVNGVRTALVLDQDIDGGEIAEQAVDYLAEDKQGNIWYLGSYTESYEGGQFVNVNDAWLAGVRGGRPGILMLADPEVGTASYSQAYVPGEGTASAKVAKAGLSQCVPFKCYQDVLVITEGTENVYYAPGVGAIKTEPRNSGGKNETEQLLNLSALSAGGLAELSAEALRLDQHASVVAKRVFGGTAPARRAA